MRCKNCGTYNDDNRYICETCGSPLYDEEDIEVNSDENEPAAQFTAVPPSPQQNINPAPQNLPYQQENDEKNPAEKKSIIVIAILAVVLVAVIASVAVIAHSKSKNNDTTTTTEPSTSQTTSQRSTTSRAERTTEPETTEEPTTTTTTTTTTTATTQAQVWYINVFTGGGGTVKGNGDYKNGEKVTISAKADSGYTFDGWYSDGIKISSSAKYTFTANGNMSISAVFTKDETVDNGIENGDAGEDLNFGN